MSAGIRCVPAGEHSVILAYDRIGREVTVNVAPGEVHALGEVVVEVGAWGNIDWPED